MTFGQVKSKIESNLIESYSNEKDFKKLLREFKHNVLSDKSMSKIYSLYDQLSSSQGLSESDAKEFLEEGIKLIQKLLPSIKLPKTILENSENKYSDLDTVVYINKLNLLERIECKKNIIKVLTSNINITKENVNIPIKSMVNIANQTLSNYVENLDEETKKEFIQLMSEDTNVLESEFEIIRESAIKKLSIALDNESEFELKTKLSETITKIKDEKFDQLNFLKLKTLESFI